MYWMYLWNSDVLSKFQLNYFIDSFLYILFIRLLVKYMNGNDHELTYTKLVK